MTSEANERPIGTEFARPEVAFTPNGTTATVMDFLITIFIREGSSSPFVIPSLRLSISETFVGQGILHRQSVIYHPQSDGQVWRFNRTLKGYIIVISLTRGTLILTITEFIGIYKPTPHAAAKMSPGELQHGRKMKMRMDIVGFP